MPIIIESEASYQFTEGEPLGAAALNAIGSPNIHTDLTAITEDDVDAVPASKLRPLHGSKIRSIQPHNLPAAEKGDIIYYDPATAEWGLLNIGDEGDFLTPLGWNSKSTPLPVSTKEVIKFQPQRGIRSINDPNEPLEWNRLLAGVYHVEIEVRHGKTYSFSNENIKLFINSELRTPKILNVGEIRTRGSGLEYSSGNPETGQRGQLIKPLGRFINLTIFLDCFKMPSITAGGSLRVEVNGTNTFGFGTSVSEVRKFNPEVGEQSAGPPRLSISVGDAGKLTVTLIRVSEN